MTIYIKNKLGNILFEHTEDFNNITKTLEAYELVNEKILNDIVIEDEKITEFNFSDYKISNSNFKNCIFDDSIFYNTVIENSTFRDCTFGDVVFERVYVEYSFFKSCKFPFTKFKNSRLFEVNWAESHTLSISFFQTTLTQATFRRTNLNCVEFISSQFKNSSFDSAKFQLLNRTT